MRALLGCGVLLAVPTGCASQTETYCDTLREQQPTLTSLAEASTDPGAGTLGDGLAVFRDLREAAPDDIRDEWDTFYFAWEGLADAFEAAGTNPEEYQPGEASAPIEDAAAELASARVVDAGAGIQQHAQDVCEVDLALDAK